RAKGFAVPLVLVVALLTLALYFLRYDFRGYALLARFLRSSSSSSVPGVPGSDPPEITVENVVIPSAAGDVPARLYLRDGVAHPRGMVIVHGIHHLGMNEPRLVSLARAAVQGGFAVLTPEISSLADYRVDGAAIGAIGAAPAWLEQRLQTGPPT